MAFEGGKWYESSTLAKMLLSEFYTKWPQHVSSFLGNHNGSLSNTKLILKLLGWLLRHSGWEWRSIYLSWCQYMSQGPFQQVWNMFPHVPSTGEVKSPKIKNFTCTYVDHSLASVPHFEYLVYVLPKWLHLEYLYSCIKHITI